MKICCFCEQWESGGIESFLITMFETIDMEDLEIDLVIANKKPSVFDKRLQHCNVNLIVFSSEKRPILENHRKFIQLIHKKKYDVIHLNLFHGLSLAYLMYGKICGIGVRIAHSHNNGLRKSKTRWLKMIVHTISQYLFCLFTTDRWACSHLAGEFLFPNSNFEIIKNGILLNHVSFDQKKRESLRRSLNLDDKIVIGHIGRLSYQKNQIFLLEIMAQLQSYSDDYVLLLVGEGEEKNVLLERAKALSLTKQVIFYDTSEDIQSLLSSMDVYVFPSMFEAFGITMIEAQANGLPVVCSTAIPLESKIMANITTISLDESLELWCKAIISLSREDADQSIHQTITEKGYVMEQVVTKIKKIYLGRRG